MGGGEFWDPERGRLDEEELRRVSTILSVRRRGSLGFSDPRREGCGERIDRKKEERREEMNDCAEGSYQGAISVIFICR